MIEENEKRYVYLIIAIVAICLIGVIFLIWRPKTKGIIESNLNVIEINEEYQDIQKEKYKTILSRVLLSSNYDELYELVDQKWKNDNNFLDKESLKNYLLENFIISSSGINFQNVEVLSTESANVYKYTFNNSGKLTSVLINEYTPYDYKISFEQNEISALSGKEYECDYDNVHYKVSTNYVSSNIVQYKLTVVSNSDDTFLWDTSDIKSITLGLTDGNAVGCSDVTTFASNIIPLEKNSNFSVDLTFNIGINNQSKIKQITFSNITKNDKSYEVIIPLLGGE